MEGSEIRIASFLKGGFEVGRLMVFELMGYLVLYYRSHSMGVRVSQHQVRKSSNVNRKSMKEEDNEQKTFAKAIRHRANGKI